MSISFTNLGKFSFIIFQTHFQFLAPSLSGTPMMPMLVYLKFSQRFLTLPSFSGVPFSFCWSDGCLVLPFTPHHWFDSCLHLLYCWCPVNYPLFQLVYPSFLIGYFFVVEILISLFSILWPIFWILHLDCRLHLQSAICRLLSVFGLVLFWDFCSVLSFGTCLFVSSFWQPSCVCFYVLCRAAISLGLGRVA